MRDVAYRVITGGLRPDHATIARFRARHEEALGGLFSQVLRLLAAEVMVSLGLLSLDGTKLAVVQLCVVHLIRASLRYASKRYWTPLIKDLKLIYTAADETAAAAALEAFAGQWEQRYPAIVRLWRAHWNEFIPFWPSRPRWSAG